MLFLKGQLFSVSLLLHIKMQNPSNKSKQKNPQKHKAPAIHSVHIFNDIIFKISILKDIGSLYD